MDRRVQPYAIHKRPTVHRNRSIYYAQFRDPKTGRRQSAVSSGCTRRDYAVRWCERHLASARDQVENITFADYATGFWKPDAVYATARIAHGYSCSRGYREIAEGNTRNHLLPVWGEIRLRDLTLKNLDDWIVSLRREGKLAPTTVNKLLQTLRTILEQAVADGYRMENPASRVKPLLPGPGQPLFCLRDTTICISDVIDILDTMALELESKNDILPRRRVGRPPEDTVRELIRRIYPFFIDAGSQSTAYFSRSREGLQDYKGQFLEMVEEILVQTRIPITLPRRSGEAHYRAKIAVEKYSPQQASAEVSAE